MIGIIKQLLFAGFSFFIALGVSVFAVLNRQDIFLIWNPLGKPLALPLYVLALGFMIFGFLLGAFMVWGNAVFSRSRQRPSKRHLNTLKEKLVLSDHKS